MNVYGVMSDLRSHAGNSSVQEHVLGSEIRPRSINGEFVIVLNDMDGIFAEEGAFDFIERVRQCVLDARLSLQLGE